MWRRGGAGWVSGEAGMQKAKKKAKALQKGGCWSGSGCDDRPSTTPSLRPPISFESSPGCGYIRPCEWTARRPRIKAPFGFTFRAWRMITWCRTRPGSAWGPSPTPRPQRRPRRLPSRRAQSLDLNIAGDSWAVRNSSRKTRPRYFTKVCSFLVIIVVVC